jgi:hypothetical protein
MNTKMMELFRQAGGTVIVGTDELRTYTDHFNPEKFAELIIRECADVATINSNQWHSAGQFVLTHFGIE